MKMKLIRASIALMMTSGAAMAQQSAQPTGRINSDRMLACKGRIDAENLARSNPNIKGYSTFQDYLSELLLGGKCNVLAKGTKVFISTERNDGETIAVRVPGETEYRYVDISIITRDGCDMNELSRRYAEDHYHDLLQEQERCQ